MVGQSSPQPSWAECASDINVEAGLNEQGATPANLNGGVGAGLQHDSVCSGNWRCYARVETTRNKVIRHGCKPTSTFNDSDSCRLYEKAEILAVSLYVRGLIYVPQAVPQNALSSTSCEVLGSLHVFVSC